MAAAHVHTCLPSETQPLVTPATGAVEKYVCKQEVKLLCCTTHLRCGRASCGRRVLKGVRRPRAESDCRDASQGGQCHASHGQAPRTRCAASGLLRSVHRWRLSGSISLFPLSSLLCPFPSFSQPAFSFLPSCRALFSFLSLFTTLQLETVCTSPLRTSSSAPSCPCRKGVATRGLTNVRLLQDQFLSLMC